MPRALDCAIVLSLALSAVVYVSGGFRLDFPWVRIGLHDWIRPLAIACALVALRAWLSRRAGAVRNNVRGVPAASSLAHITLSAIVLASIGYSLVFLTTVSGGSDSYGYVSASQQILKGRLIEPQEVSTWLPVANALDVATPAGYVPAADGRGIAPLYPLGLPALMALATLVAGPVGPYLVPPVCGIAALLLAWRLGTIWYGPLTGWLAAALAAWEPLVLTYAKQPMSDVPATMWSLLSLWCLAKPQQWPFAAGLAAGASFVTRPGGVGGVAVLAALAAAGGDGRARRVMWFACGAAPFALLQALLQWRLFGDPLTSGYGPVANLYAGGEVWGNLGIYGHAMWRTHSWLWFAGVAAAWFTPRRLPAALGLSLLVVSGLPYVFYFRFDHWETLRFLMPAIVALSIAAAGGLVSIAARRGPPWIPPLVATVCALIVAAESERFLRGEHVPQLREAEMRYPLVAQHIRRTTATDAVVLAAQHSGSIRHYADRVTLRWDLLRPEDLEAAVGALTERGHAVYVALEGEEQQRFADRFSDPLTRLHMYPFGQVRNIQFWKIVAMMPAP